MNWLYLALFVLTIILVPVAAVLLIKPLRAKLFELFLMYYARYYEHEELAAMRGKFGLGRRLSLSISRPETDQRAGEGDFNIKEFSEKNNLAVGNQVEDRLNKGGLMGGLANAAGKKDL